MFQKTRAFTLVFFCWANVVVAQDSLSLIFTGDIMGHIAQVKSARRANSQHDYSLCFEHVRPYFERADLAIGNLEVTLPGRRPYTGYMQLPIFRSPNALPMALQKAGIDILMTANNHSNDSQRRGIKHTIRTLDRLGIRHTGTFRNRHERRRDYPLIVEEKGFKIAFINATSYTNYLPTLPPSRVNKIKKKQLVRDLQKARAAQPDFIIAVMHWGNEHQLTESPKQRATAQFLADNGADLIVGMHPHVVQPIETIEAHRPDGTTRPVLVAYSLGNFISDHHFPYTDCGLMLEMTLRRQQGQTALVHHQAITVMRHIYAHPIFGKTYTVLPMPTSDR